MASYNNVISFKGDLTNIDAQLLKLKSNFGNAYNSLGSIAKKLDPELVENIRNLDKVGLKTVELKNKLQTFKLDKSGILKGVIDSDVISIKKAQNELKKYQAQYRNAKTPRAKSSAKLSVDAAQGNVLKAYNTELGRLSKSYDSARTSASIYTKEIDKLQKKELGLISTSKRQQQALKNTTIANKSLSKSQTIVGTSMKDMSSDVERLLRRYRTLLIGVYALKRGYDATLGTGHEYNKLLENETAGMKILAVQNLKNIDSLGRKITLTEKYNIATKESVKMLDLVRKINPETPYNLGDTIKTYKSLFPQLIKYKASLEDIAEVTKKMTILGKAMNLDTGQFIKTIDTAFTGTMKPSQMQIALNQVGITNKLVKQWQKSGTLVDNLLARLSQIDPKLSGISQNFDTIASNFKTQWDELWGEIQKPIFDNLKTGIEGFSVSIRENKEDIVGLSGDIATVIEYAGEFAVAYGSVGLALKLSNRAIALNTALQLANARALGQSHLMALNYGKAVSANAIKLRAMGRALKTFALTNPVLLGATVLMGGYELATRGAREQEELLSDAVNKSRDQILKLGIEQKKQSEEAIRLKIEELKAQNEAIKSSQTQRGFQRVDKTTVYKNADISIYDQITTSEEKLDQMVRLRVEKNNENVASLTKQLNIYKSVVITDEKQFAILKKNSELSKVLTQEKQKEERALIAIENAMKKVAAKTLEDANNTKLTAERKEQLAILNEEELVTLQGKYEKSYEIVQLKTEENEKAKDAIRKAQQFLETQGYTTQEINNAVYGMGSLGDEIGKATTKAYKLANAIRSAVTSLQNVMINGDVLSGAISRYDGDIKQYVNKLKDVNEKLRSASDAGNAVDSIKYQAEKEKILQEMKSRSIQYNKSIIEQQFEINRLKIEESLVGGKILSQKDRAVASTKKEVAILRSEVEKAKALASSGDTSQEGIRVSSLKIRKAELELAKALRRNREAELDLTVKNSKASASAGKKALASRRKALAVHNRQIKAYDKELKYDLDILKIKNSQELIQAQIDAGGTAYLSKLAKLRLEEKALTKEKALQLKLIEKTKETLDKTKSIEDKKKIEKELAKNEKQLAKIELEIQNNINLQIENPESLQEFLLEAFDLDKNKELKQALGKYGDVIGNGITNIISALGSDDPFALSDAAGSFVVAGLDRFMPGLGKAASAIGSLFSSEVSQAEIDASKGRVEFSDESLSKLADTFANAENPLLPHTKKMSGYLRGIKDNTFALTKSFNVSNGLRVDGSDFVPISKGNIWGGKSTELLDSSLRLGNIDFGGDVEADLVKQILVKKSSWFGLIKKSNIRSVVTDAGAEFNKGINDILVGGKDFIIEASATLGQDVESQLARYNAEIADISLKGLSDTEAEARLNQAFGEIFSSAIDSLDSIGGLVDRYAKSGEESLATLGRIATEFEQTSYQFSQVGIKFADETSTFKTVDHYETLVRVVEGEVKKIDYLTETIKTLPATTEEYVKHWTEVVDTTYTAEQKVLDIVKNLGGQENFNDIFGGFINNFYTDTEKLKFQTTSLRNSFSSLGVEMPKNDEAMRALIETYPRNTEEQIKTYSSLLQLTDSFHNMTEASNSLKEAEESRLKEQLEAEKSRLKEQLETSKQYASKLNELMIGQYSPLRMLEKQQYANNALYSSKENRLEYTLRVEYDNAVKEEDYRESFYKLANFYESNSNMATTLKDIDKSLQDGNDLLEEQIEQIKEENALLKKQLEYLKNIDDTNKNDNISRRVS